MRTRKTNSRLTFLASALFVISIGAFTLSIGIDQGWFGDIPAKPAGSHAMTRQLSMVQNESDFGSITIDQGDKFLAPHNDGTDASSACTVGYIDRPAHSFYTAAHCLTDGEEVLDDDWKPIGVGRVIEGRDSGFVELYPEVNAGHNKFSGDKIDANGVTTGDSVCVFGQKTNAIMCDAVTSVDDETEFNLGGSAVGQQGDSGGPAWTSEGIVGTYSGIKKEESTGRVMSAYVTVL